MAEVSEVCFPRGGLPLLSKKNYNKASKKSSKKLKNSKNYSKEGSVKKPQPTPEDTDDLDRLARSEDKKAQKINVQYLSFENMKKGLLVLGCIVEIQPDKLIISLPNSITGMISITEISPAFTKMQQKKSFSSGLKAVSDLFDFFEVGQLLVCGVIEVNPDLKEIHLTLNPTIINSRCDVSKMTPGMHISGYVKSVEDHGCIIDVGNNAVHAFIPTANQGSDVTFKQHQVVRCSVVQVKSSGRILILSHLQCRLNNVLTKEFLGDNLESLHPGTIINFSHVFSKHRGKIGKIGNFYSSVSMVHSSPKLKTLAPTEMGDDRNTGPAGKKRRQNDENDEKETKKRKLDLFEFACKPIIDSTLSTGCILYTLHRTAVVSLNPAVWKDDQRTKMHLDFKEKYRIGQKYTVSVLDKISGVGAVCQLHKNGPFGIVNLDNISDDPHAGLDGLVLQEKLEVRVIGNVSLDGIINLSAKKSVCNAAYLSSDDVQPGDVVEAQIVDVTKSGMEVRLGSRHGKKFVSCPVAGFVPSFHLSDINLKTPEKVFRINELLRCRVLFVDSEHNLITLTNKQSLVQSDLPIIYNYDQLSVGQIVHVYIKAIKEQGCVVGLYNNLRGFVPKNEINLPLSSPIRDEYHPGQVVRARVCACNPRENKLVMSFITEVKRRKKP